VGSEPDVAGWSGPDSVAEGCVSVGAGVVDCVCPLSGAAGAVWDRAVDPDAAATPCWELCADAMFSMAALHAMLIAV